MVWQQSLRLWQRKSGIQIPTNEQGFHDNSWEYNKFRSMNTDGRYARCRNIDIDDIPILVMERLSKISVQDRPSWADFIDYTQVGKDENGNVKAYDYA